jgi:hypothetical protein
MHDAAHVELPNGTGLPSSDIGRTRGSIADVEDS